MGEKLSQWVSVLAVAGLLLVAVALGVREAKDRSTVTSGTPAPPFSMTRDDGSPVTLESLRGRVVMLDFWATWCPPCVAEMPMLVKIAAEYESKGLTFLAANRDDPDDARERVAQFSKKRVPDLKPYVTYAHDAMTRDYKIEVLPTLVFIDKHGNVLSTHIGVASESSVRRWVEKALEAP